MLLPPKAYPTDLSDAAWERLAPLLPVHSGRGRRMQLELRAVINAIRYVVRSGCPWRLLPKEYPHWNSVYYHFRKWCKDGTWRRINQELRRQDRRRQGRGAEPSAAIIDSQSVKTTEAGGERGFDAGKKVNGRKRHIVVDTIGNLLEVVVHAACIQDRDGAKLVFTKLLETVDSLKKIWADSSYRGQLIDWVHHTLNAVLEIVNKDPDQHGFQVLPRRWVVERTLAWLGRYRRLSKDYERCTLSSEGMIYLASMGTLLQRVA